MSIMHWMSRWQRRGPSPELALEYLKFAPNLLFSDKYTVQETVKVLRSNIERWAVANCPALIGKTIVEKKDLLDKDQWYVPFLAAEAAPMRSSGTTGERFAYRRWDKVLFDIEATNHYDLILNEFGIGPDPHILYLLLNHRTNDFVQVHKAVDLIERHGVSRNTTVHLIDYGEYTNDHDKFYEKLIQYISENKIDVITTSGQYVNALVYHIIRLKHTGKLATLISNTGQPLLSQDADYLKQNGMVDSVCDHMRCWDGGATFFTCKKGTYHLLDNLSYCYSDHGKLISTDYFSFPAPFVNYWSGDRAEISESYERCKCGRLYRPFRFRQTRSLFVKGQQAHEFRQQVESSSLPVESIQFSSEGIDLVSSRELDDNEKVVANNIFKGLPIRHRINLLDRPIANLGMVFGSKANTQVFNSNGTFTVPTGKTIIQIEAWGGGGGGEVSTPLATGGGGGGGGAYSTSILTLVSGATHPVLVGQGGQATTGRPGFTGSDSQVSTPTGTVMAKGGNGAAGAQGQTGGAGGLASASVGTTKFDGGTGANATGTVGQGGGGGGGAGDNGNGGNAVGLNGGIAGTAGGGQGGNGTPANGAGTAGSDGGGGGGGGGQNAGLGAAGGNGRVICSWN